MEEQTRTSKTHLRWSILSRSNPYKVRREYLDVVQLGNSAYFLGIIPGDGYGLVVSFLDFGWKPLNFPNPPPRRFHHVATLAGDKIYIYGGRAPSIDKELKGHVVVDPVMESAHALETSTAGPRKRHQMTAVWAPWRREIVYFGGHRSPNLVFNDVHAFDVDSSRWRRIEMKGSLPAKRTGHSAVLVGTKMYIYGGHTSLKPFGGFLQDMFIADLRGLEASASWSAVALHTGFPTARTLAALNYARGVIVMFGGYSSRHYLGQDLNCYSLTWDSGMKEIVKEER